MLSYYFILLMVVKLSYSQQSAGIIPGLVSKCSEGEIQEIEERRKKCVSQKETAFQSSQVEKTQGLLCSYIEQIIEDCSEEYTKCYNEVQMKQFKSLQIQIFEQLIGAHKDSGLKLDACDTYEKYKSSPLSDSNCNAAKIGQISKKYGACINKTNSFQSRFEEIVSKPNALKEIENIFCEFYRILDGCSNILRECYSEDKLKETSFGQLDIIKGIMQQTGLQLPTNCDSQEKNEPAGAGSIIASISLLVPLIHLVN